MQMTRVLYTSILVLMMNVVFSHSHVAILARLCTSFPMRLPINFSIHRELITYGELLPLMATAGHVSKLINSCVISSFSSTFDSLTLMVSPKYVMELNKHLIEQ